MEIKKGQKRTTKRQYYENRMDFFMPPHPFWNTNMLSKRT